MKAFWEKCRGLVLEMPDDWLRCSRVATWPSPAGGAERSPRIALNGTSNTLALVTMDEWNPSQALLMSLVESPPANNSSSAD